MSASEVRHHTREGNSCGAHFGRQYPEDKGKQFWLRPYQFLKFAQLDEVHFRTDEGFRAQSVWFSRYDCGYAE
jgi:hypothetical protein